MANVVPVILAGGSGTRLWPESRSRMPKHLAPLLGDRSLLQQTAERVMALETAHSLLCVGAESQDRLIREQLASLDPSWAEHVLLEPVGRNTAAAIELAAQYAMDRFGEDTIIWVCPSDHVMLNSPALLESVRHGVVAAERGYIVTFGIAPSRPETGYGYIAVGGKLLDDSSIAGVFAVERFVEKPPLEEAQRMLATGGFLWNSGMFLMRANDLATSMIQFEPEIAKGVRVAFEIYKRDGILTSEAYGSIKSMPVDKAVMERSDRMAVVPCDPAWSDVGGWQAIWEISEQDAAGNARKGDVVCSQSLNNLVWAQSRLVCLAGVEDLAVIETADAILVADRHAGEEIKSIVAELDAAGRAETVDHVLAGHEWGSERALADEAGASVSVLRIAARKIVGDQQKPSHYLVLDPGASGLRQGQTIALEAGDEFEINGVPSAPVVVLKTVLASSSG